AFAAWSLTFAATAQRAEGVVIQNYRTKERRSVIHPIVRFEAEGWTVDIKGRVGTKPALYSVGDAVPVLYQSGNPANAVIDNFSEQYLFPLIFGGIGAVFYAIGGGFWLVPALLAR